MRKDGVCACGKAIWRGSRNCMACRPKSASVRKTQQALKTHCKWGHEFTSENVYTYLRKDRMQRACLVCRNLRSKKAGERRKLRGKRRPTEARRPMNPLYREELARVLKKRADEIARVHDQVQARINLPFTFRESTGYMQNDDAPLPRKRGRPKAA